MRALLVLAVAAILAIPAGASGAEAAIDLGECETLDGELRCATAPLPLTADAFLDGYVAASCSAADVAPTDLAGRHALFVKQASEQYATAMQLEAVRAVGALDDCGTMCGCAGCVGATILGVFVMLCGGCFKCCGSGGCDTDCESPQIWKSSCACTGGEVAQVV